MTLIDIDPAFLRAHALPRHDEGGDKQLRGRVLIIAGSAEVPGGALLAAHGALRAGAGVLQIATCRSVAQQLAITMPEARVVGCAETQEGGIEPSSADRLGDLAANSDAVLIGPGMLDLEATAALVRQLLARKPDAAFVLDAAALTTLDGSADLPRHLVLTPHAGEMARFLDVAREEVEGAPLDAAHRVARQLGAVVAMKGAETHIVAPDGRTWCSRNGSIGLGTSGSGDVLAGVIVGLLARKTPPELATIWGVYLHAEAGRRLEQKHGPLGLLARELPAEVPAIMRDLQQN